MNVKNFIKKFSPTLISKHHELYNLAIVLRNNANVADHTDSSIQLSQTLSKRHGLYHLAAV